MNSFSTKQEATEPSSTSSRHRRARRHRNSRRHLRRPLLTRFTNDQDLLQAILARQIVPNDENIERNRYACMLAPDPSGESDDGGGAAAFESASAMEQR